VTAAGSSPERRDRSSRPWLIFGGALLAVLLGGVFTLGSLNIPFAPDTRTEFIVLFALSTFNIVALFVFGLMLVRSLFRLWIERRTDQLGARFKTKMVLGAMGISLLPLIFMFFVSYALMNRTLNKWFSRPLETAVTQSQQLLDDMIRNEHLRLLPIAERLRAEVERAEPKGMSGASLEEQAQEAGADMAGHFRPGAEVELHVKWRLTGGAELWQIDSDTFVCARLPLSFGFLVVGHKLPSTFLQQYAEVAAQRASYVQQGQGLRTFKNQILLTLALLTVLLMFSAMWFALFLSKQVTGPIQALAQGTLEVSKGNLGYQVAASARDELGVLVGSFNQMTRQLADSRLQLDDFTRNLQKAVTEIEERRKLMETILENVPTAVLSLDAQGAILRANQAVGRIFGNGAMQHHTLGELMGADAARALEALMRKALRMGTATQELEIALPGHRGASGRVLRAAVTVSALGPRRSNPGFVVVIDDLTELLRAQKAAAWQSVAQRIAHEIKNPLTPIQLSAQRLTRHLERTGGAVDAELSGLVGECVGLIEREAGTLKSLVDEFSQFARFPAAKPAAVDLNPLVAGALEVFAGRLDGVTVRSEYGADLPRVKADAELLRRVLVNLVDNAAEAMEGSPVRELQIATRASAGGEMVEIVVADSGHGISSEDKEKLFLPHFSTRGRGTGLGLAITHRIVTEHGGAIRVEDNHPVGARFVIRLPVAEIPAGEPVLQEKRN
jgi:PAS domain S-box-containing protein